MSPTGEEMIEKVRSAVRAVNEMAEAWSDQDDIELRHRLRQAVSSIRLVGVLVGRLTGATIDLKAGLSGGESSLRRGHLRIVPRGPG